MGLFAAAPDLHLVADEALLFVALDDGQIGVEGAAFLDGSVVVDAVVDEEVVLASVDEVLGLQQSAGVDARRLIELQSFPVQTVQCSEGNEEQLEC